VKSDVVGQTLRNTDQTLPTDCYQVLCDHSSVVTVYTTPQGVIEVISPAVTELLGWHPHDMVGHPVFEFVHHDDVTMAARAHQDLNEGRAVQLTMRLCTKGGDHRWVMAKITPILGVDGGVIGRLGALQELDSEHQLRHALERQEQVFRRVIDQAADAVVHTVDGVVVWVSASLERVTGWRRSEFIGTSSSQWVYPDDRDAMRHLRDHRRFESPGTARFRMVCRDGSHRWFEVLSTPLPTAEAGVEAVSILRDVSERVQAEQARDAMEHRLAVTLDTMFDPHSYLRPIRDDAGTVVDLEFERVNDALCRYLRCQRADIEGHRVSELLPRHVDGGIVARAREVLDSGVPFVAEGLRSWNDMLGAYRLYDITVIAVDGSVAMWHRDVTARFARFDAEARLQSREVLQAERDRVARDLHDGAIQKVFATSMQLAALAALVTEPHRRRVEELIDLQDAVIRDLRATVYQLGTTGRSSASSTASIHHTAAEATRALGFAPEVMVDDRIERLEEPTLGHVLLVLREALSNIARHAHAHHVEVSLIPAGSDVMLSVWDDGVGLPADVVFGDGLRNMERRAQLLGGSSRISSEPGPGTELLWRVPITTA
jgi:PAS domain S-box-containing protein